MFSFWDTWFSGTVALAIGAVAGLIAALRLMKRGSAGDDLEMKLNDLEEQIEHMVSQLKDIELQRERIAESFYAEQKAHYEGKAAELMRARDEVVDQLNKLSGDRETIAPMPQRKGKKDKKVEAAATPAETAEVAPAPAFAFSPQVKGALWGGGTVLVIGALFFSVSSEQRERAPGGSITGNTQPGQGTPIAQAPVRPGEGPAQAQAAQPQDPKIQEMMARVENDPNDVEAMNYITGRLVMGGAVPEAKRLNSRVLEVDPQNVQGQIWAAMIGSAQGDVSGAVTALEAIIEKHDEKAPDAYFFRGMLAMQGGDQPTMKKYWSRFVEVAPPSPRRDRIAQMIQAMPQ